MLRNRYVIQTPEEKIRQALIQKMVDVLGFPKGLLSIERGMGKRRYDLICYSQKMVPLLLVECKAGAIDERAIRQILGYNSLVKAPFLCLAGCDELITFWEEKTKRVSIPFLPKFIELSQCYLEESQIQFK